MAKIVCRCSMLKCDDVRLKAQLQSCRWCDLCDMSVEEDAVHCILRCPTFQDIRVEMFQGIYIVYKDTSIITRMTKSGVLRVSLGAQIEEVCMQ